MIHIDFDIFVEMFERREYLYNRTYIDILYIYIKITI